MKQEARSPLKNRVLIVDDRSDIRTLLRTRLELDDNIEVVGEAQDGFEALGLITDLAPGAVVLDLHMPGMGGNEAIPLMRQLAPNMRILLFTADGDLEVLRRGGADAVVSKSQPLAVLVNQLQLLLALGTSTVSA